MIGYFPVKHLQSRRKGMRIPSAVSLFILVFLLNGAIQAQYKVSPQHLYERIYAVVPMVGAGTYDDPRRPMFVVTDKNRWRNRIAPQIIGYSYQVSDDGRLALVEFVARDPKALEPILSSRLANIRVFRKTKVQRQLVEQEFRKHKRDFDWNKFGVLAQ